MKQVILLFCMFPFLLSFTNSKIVYPSDQFNLNYTLINRITENNKPLSEIKSKKKAPLLMRILERKISKFLKNKKENETNRFANASYISGIISIVTFLGGLLLSTLLPVALIAAILALVFGFSAEKNQNNQLRKKAKAGIIMGAVVLILSILLVILALLLLAAA